MQAFQTAAEFEISTWLNSDEPLSLAQCQGKVVMAIAFQMLCPGCVEVSLPQAKQVYAAFSSNEVQVIGLHTVFEHHEAMQEASLRAFLHEYRIGFPVGIDASSDNESIPRTMQRYQMQGTPTLLLIDRMGRLRKQQFGHTPDLLLGAELMALIKENDSVIELSDNADKRGCTPQGCNV